MWRFVMPLIPLTVYSTFQGQISVFIISIFGNTDALAATGALSRLNQLFAPATYLIGWVVAPYFSRLSQSIVFRRYLQIMGVALSLIIVVGIAVWIYPYPLLWLLGSNYMDLEFEVGLAVISNGIGICAALTYNLIYSRRLIGRRHSIALIIGSIGFQIIVTPWVDLSTTKGVLFIGLAAAVGSLVVSCVYGLLKIPRS
jgi:Na+-driven multidrug efflux pump